MSTPEQGTHFYSIAIQYPRTDDTFGVVHAQGTYTPSKRETRFDVFGEIYGQMMEMYPQAADGVVLAFDIQPNKL